MINQKQQRERNQHFPCCRNCSLNYSFTATSLAPSLLNTQLSFCHTLFFCFFPSFHLFLASLLSVSIRILLCAQSIWYSEPGTGLSVQICFHHQLLLCLSGSQLLPASLSVYFLSFSPLHTCNPFHHTGFHHKCNA